MTARKKPAAMPFFGDAYLADTTHLTTEEHGAYFLLLLAAWRQHDCALPLDDRKLARIAGLSVKKWAAMRATILEFFTIENGRIFQERQRKEYVWVCQKSEGSRKSAEARWGKQPPENLEGEGMRTHSDGNAPPPPPPIEEPIGSSTPIVPTEKTEPSIDQQKREIVALWNAVALPLTLPRCLTLSPKRDRALGARLKQYGLDDMKRAILAVPRSAFLRGDEGDWRGASFDFILQPDTPLKILEGKYDDRTKSARDTRDGLLRAVDAELGLG